MTSAPSFAALSRLIGSGVTDNQGVIVGHVTDILFDQHDGRIAYIQLFLERGSGDATRRITVPWSSFASTVDAPATLQLRVGRATLLAYLSNN